jgi:Holliday junction resolvasome RuvABC ATP-dependent DNA helicase subunit
MYCSMDPPGLGKTTLANIIANELGVNSADHVRSCH